MSKAGPSMWQREWMGIEPTRRRASDASTALKAAGDSAQLLIPKALTDSRDSVWWADWWKNAPDAHELGDVILSWPTLPAAVRAGVVAMVRAAATTPP